MQAGIAIGRRAAWPLLLWMCLLACVGCNLSAVPAEAPSRFEGAPVIRIAAPQPDQRFLAGATVIVQARIENAGPDLARVAVLLDEALLGERLTPNETAAAVLPLTIDWLASQAGQYTIAVVAEREDGSAAREEVAIEVVSRQDPAAMPSTETARDMITARPPLSPPPATPPENPGPDDAPDVNLFVSGIELVPVIPVCGQATTIRVAVRNTGSLDMQTSPWVSVTAHRLSDQSVSAENPETFYLSKLDAGQETALELSLVISAGVGERQQIRVTVDAGNHIVESDETDNIGRSAEFELSQGNCA